MVQRKLFAGGEFLIIDPRPEDVFIPEQFSQEHRLVREAAADFVKCEIQPNIEQIDCQDRELTRALLLKAGELGLNATDIPVAFGGEGLDTISTCLVTEALGGCGSFAVSHAAHTGIGTLPIAFFGNETQKRRYLRGSQAVNGCPRIV